MGMRFSEDGPWFPTDLIDAMLAGEVVFLCGAGVSAPQLPNFQQLVERVYKRLGVEPEGAEADSLKGARFEEALGVLSRRIVSPDLVLRAVDAELQIDNPVLDNHQTLLRLSRDAGNRVVLITTNFDTLFERALEQAGAGSARGQSLAGQALPPPGGPGFAGVVHLHGRLADPAVDVEASPLVLTSADYGDAYMRSGWASRFLFDLARCRTVVLVGYSAGDAPMRYFLNLLESDRERFSDLRTVYAFDAGAGPEDPALARWDAVAVKVLAYRTREGGSAHQALWDDLGALAGLLDRPRGWRRARAAEILALPRIETSQDVLDELEWLLTVSREVTDIVVAGTADPEWLNWILGRNLLSERDRAWVPAAWCSQDWNSRSRLHAAVAWRKQLGEPFVRALDLRLWQVAGAASVYAKAWDLLARWPPVWDTSDHRPFRLAPRLANPECADLDLQEAIGRITPRLVMELPYFIDAEAAADPKKLHDVIRCDLSVSELDFLAELVQALDQADHHHARLLEIATHELAGVIATAAEVDWIGPDWDILNSDVPSVERHPQNEYHDGAAALVTFITGMLPKLAAADPAAGRDLARTWRSLPSRLGPRLWCQALRNADLFAANEAASEILKLSHDSFWHIRRELILLMVERLGDADPGLVAQICARVLLESRDLYTDYDIEGTDWRPPTRDRDAWLRLTALRQAGVLPPEGVEALAAIAERFPSITGDFEEEDLFDSYSGGIRTIEGNPEVLMDLDPGERLAKAQSFSADRGWDSSGNWRAYCSTDPAGALDVLRQSQFSDADIPLWSSMIQSLRLANIGATDDKIAKRRVHVVDLFGQLDRAGPEAVGALATDIADLLSAAAEAGLQTDPWWDRLWAIIEVQTEPFVLETSERLFDRAINSAAGRLAEHFLAMLDARKRSRRRLGDADRARLIALCAADSPAGWLARAALTRAAGFLVYLDRSTTTQHLRPRLVADNLEGRTLRAALVRYGRMGARATTVFRAPLVMAVIESQAQPGEMAVVVSRILAPMLSQQLYAGRTRWGMQDKDVRFIFRQAPATVEGAAQLMLTWARKLDGFTPEQVWRDGIGPLFKLIWPLDRRYKTAALSGDLAAICALAGPAFPEAFETIKPYLCRFDGERGNLFHVEQTAIADNYPELTLDLLWTLCGPPWMGQSADLAKLLDRILKARPDVETDRRFQWLDQRALRY
jgi:hypothetical protein